MMPMYSGIKSFTGLTAWQTAHSLASAVYKVTEKFPQAEQFGIVKCVDLRFQFRLTLQRALIGSRIKRKFSFTVLHWVRFRSSRARLDYHWILGSS